jgi:hypothetical protein
MKCPITGDEVFPSITLLKNVGDRIIDCPACGQQHRWLILASKLVELVEREGTDLSEKPGASHDD